MIPFVDLKPIHKPLRNSFQTVLDNCLNASDFVTGAMVSKFEEEFANYCNTKHCVGVSSGTAALFLALKALGVQEGDEVIIPSHTFIATAMAVSQCGAIPIFVDVNESSWNITWDNILPKITSRNFDFRLCAAIFGLYLSAFATIRASKLFLSESKILIK